MNGNLLVGRMLLQIHFYMNASVKVTSQTCTWISTVSGGPCKSLRDNQTERNMFLGVNVACRTHSHVRTEVKVDRLCKESQDFCHFFLCLCHTCCFILRLVPSVGVMFSLLIYILSATGVILVT